MKKFRWLAAAYAAAVVSLFAAHRASADVDPEQWTDETFVLIPASPGVWNMSLAMSSAGGESILAPIGTISGSETLLHTNTSLPAEWYGTYKLSASSFYKLSGTLTFDPILAAQLNLNASIPTSFSYNKWVYDDSNDQTKHAMVTAVAADYSPESLIYATIEKSYKNSLDPDMMSVMDETNTPTLPAPSPTPMKLSPWRYVIPLAPIAIGETWDWIKRKLWPTSTPAPVPPTPTGPGSPQAIANCKGLVDKTASLATQRAAASACPPAVRVAAAQCIEQERLNQHYLCDNNLPGAPSTPGFAPCGPLCP